MSDPQGCRKKRKEEGWEGRKERSKGWKRGGMKEGKKGGKEEERERKREKGREGRRKERRNPSEAQKDYNTLKVTEWLAYKPKPCSVKMLLSLSHLAVQLERTMKVLKGIGFVIWSATDSA